MMKIFLDDIRTPVDDTHTVVRDYEEFIKIVTNTDWVDIQEISFDHDLGFEAIRHYYEYTQETGAIDYNRLTEKTGYDCVKWLCEYALNKTTFPKVFVHSANSVGCENMINYLNNFFKHNNLDNICVKRIIEHTLDYDIRTSKK